MEEKNNHNELIPEIVPILDAISGQSGAKVEIEQAGSTPNMEYFEIKLSYENEKGEDKEENYFVKRFLKKRRGTMANFFQSKIGNIQDTENEILSRYKNAGCRVPSPYIKIKNNTLILEMIKGDDLEKRLLENKDKEDERASLIEKVSLALSDLHNAGRKIQGGIFTSKKTADKYILNILDSGSLIKRADYYFTALAADEKDLIKIRDQENGTEELVDKTKGKYKDNLPTFNSFFENLEKYFSTQETQLIHGDMTTYHAVIDKDEEPWFIDFGKPKFSHIVFDIAPLYFSQDTNLPFERIEEIFIKYLERESMNLTGTTGKLSKDRITEEIKAMYLGGFFSNIRRGAKNRFSRIVFPEEYSWFIEKHPSYADSLSFYKSSTYEGIEYFLRNKDRFKIDEESYKAMGNFLGPLEQFLSGKSYDAHHHGKIESYKKKHKIAKWHFAKGIIKRVIPDKKLAT